MNTPVQNIYPVPADHSPDQPCASEYVISRCHNRQTLVICQTDPFYAFFRKLLPLNSNLLPRPFLFEIGFKGEKGDFDTILDYFKQIRDNLRLHKWLAQTEIANIKCFRHSCQNWKRQPPGCVRTEVS